MFTDSKNLFAEKAQRVLFFARYEAARSYDVCVEAEHLLLGLIRADSELFHKLYQGERDIVVVIRSVFGQTDPVNHKDLAREEVPSLSHTAEAVLQSAVVARRDFGDRYVETEHLLLGLLKLHDSRVEPILSELGLTADALQKHIASRSLNIQTGELADKPALTGHVMRDD